MWDTDNKQCDLKGKEKNGPKESNLQLPNCLAIGISGSFSASHVRIHSLTCLHFKMLALIKLFLIHFV